MRSGTDLSEFLRIFLPTLLNQWWFRGQITFCMLNSAEYEFLLPINDKIPTTVDILTQMSRKNNILGSSEP